MTKRRCAAGKKSGRSKTLRKRGGGDDIDVIYHQQRYGEVVTLDIDTHTRGHGREMSKETWKPRGNSNTKKERK